MVFGVNVANNPSSRGIVSCPHVLVGDITTLAVDAMSWPPPHLAGGGGVDAPFTARGGAAAKTEWNRSRLRYRWSKITAVYTLPAKHSSRRGPVLGRQKTDKDRLPPPLPDRLSLAAIASSRASPFPRSQPAFIVSAGARRARRYRTVVSNSAAPRASSGIFCCSATRRRMPLAPS